MNRILATLFFVAIALVATDCSAQRVGRRFQRHSLASHQQPSTRSREHQSQTGKTLSNYRNPVVSRVLDGPQPLKPRDPAEVNSRYLGGFHYSQFDNIGIPSGDIGIRGNAYQWNTW